MSHQPPETVEGTIIFGGYHEAPPAKYSIISSTSRVDEVVKFFGEDVPKAIISVIGGVEELEFDEDKFQKVFNKGIILAAQNSGAWIVTDGLNRNASECIGNALDQMDADSVLCVGVGLIDKITEHDVLERGGEHEYFSSKSSLEDATVALEPHHTHFVLMRKTGVWGGEIDFRKKFENHYSHSMGVPTILVVIGGGPSTFLSIAEALHEGTPIIVVDQSGEASDAIVSYLRHHEDQAQFKLDVWEEYIADLEVEEKAKYVTIMAEAVKYRDSISIYDASEAGSMDKHILRGILAFSQDASLDGQMALGVKWGRIDIIEELLEGDVTSDIKANAIDASVDLALIHDKPEVFELLIKKGGNISNVNLDKLFTLDKESIDKLKPLSSGYWPGNAISKRFSSVHITGNGKGLSSSQDDGDVSMPLLSASKETYAKGGGIALARGVLHQISESYSEIITEHGQTNFMGVFVWAILIGRDEMARVIWRNLSYPVHAALVASHINSYLGSRFQQDPSYDEKTNWFEAKAIAVLNETNYDNGNLILKYKCPELNGLNVLQIADLTNCKEFTSHLYVQQVINEKLYGDEYGHIRPETKLLKILMLVLFPFLLPFSSTYVRTDPTAKWYYFYLLPVVKIFTWTISYIVFLALLTINVAGSVTSDYSIKWQEIALAVWTITFIYEEFDQYRSSGGTYLNSISNQIDVMRALGLLIYIVLRVLAWQLESHPIAVADVDVLIVTNIICYFRLTHIFTVDKHLGTLFFIIVRLFRDVFMWIVICIVIMIGFQVGIFGLTKQAGFDPWTFYPGGTLGVAVTTFFGDQGENTMQYMSDSSIGVVFISIYAVISQIMLVNLLIAMMGSTYSDVKDNSDKEWKFYRYRLINEFMNTSPYPQPINTIMIPFEYIIEKCSTPTAAKPEKPSANVITKMKVAKDAAIAKERIEEINSIEFLSAFVRESTHQATIQANGDRSAIKLTLKKMQTSINSQFKDFGQTLAKQQATFADMQAATMTQFTNFYTLLATQQNHLDVLKASNSEIDNKTVQNKELQITNFHEMSALLTSQQSLLKELQENQTKLALQASQMSEIQSQQSKQLQELSVEVKKQASSPLGVSGGNIDKDLKIQLDAQETALNKLQHSMVNLHQSVSTLLERTKTGSN